MTARSYSVLAASIFTVVAILQLVRAISGWPVMVGDMGFSATPRSKARVRHFGGEINDALDIAEKVDVRIWWAERPCSAQLLKGANVPLTDKTLRCFGCGICAVS